MSEGVIKSEELIPTELLQAGDVVKVIRGSKVPCDGEIVWGQGTCDEWSPPPPPLLLIS